MSSSSPPPLRDRVRPLALASERVLPVPAVLAGLLPEGGLRRGTVVGVGGSGATSLAVALLAEASRTGAWVAAVGLPTLGLVAVAELGLDLERLVLVTPPDPARWGAATAALVGAFEAVMVRPTHRVRDADARRLEARARERGTILVQVGGRADAWPHGVDLRLTVTEAAWTGLHDGHGRLRSRRVVVEVGGRRQATRARRAELWLPAADGSVTAVTRRPASPVPIATDPVPVPTRQAG